MGVHRESYENDGYQYGIVKTHYGGVTEVFFPAENSLMGAYREYRDFHYYDLTRNAGNGDVRIERRPVGAWERIPQDAYRALREQHDKEYERVCKRPWIEGKTTQ